MAKQAGSVKTGILSWIKGIMIVVWVVISSVIYSSVVIVVSIFSQKKARTVARLWCRHLLLVSGVRYEVFGMENLDPNALYVFVSNHQSALDIPVLYAGLPRDITFIGKKELFRIPFFGWGLAACGMIWIDRSSARRARKSLTRAVHLLKTRQICPVIFPEGTRSSDGTIAEFKKGSFSLAIESGAPVVPVTLVGTRNALPKHAFLIRSTTVQLYMANPISSENLDPVTGKPVLAAQTQEIISNMYSSKSMNPSL